MKRAKISAIFLSCTALVCVQVNYAATAFAQVAPAPVPLSNEDIIFRAVDSGDVAHLKGHFDFIRTFHTVDPNIISNNTINLNFRDNQGNTPLIRAAMHNNLDIVRVLVDNGADINAVNNNNESALFTSYTYKNYDISRYLLAQGAADPFHLSDLVKQQQQEIVHQKVREADNNYDLELLGGGAALAGAAGLIAAFSSGSGSSSSSGGGGSSADNALNPQNLDPTTFVTQEAMNQQGILAMNTQYALARGYNGSIYSRNSDGTLISDTPTGNVKVAVVDTGIDLTHPDLEANILTADSVTCDDTGCVAGGGAPTGGSENWHGTAVAGIIAAEMNGVGIYGVAPDAKIISVGFADLTTGDLTNGDAPGIQSALASGAQVINGSYAAYSAPNVGISPPTANISDVEGVIYGSSGGTNLATQFQAGVAAHAIFVFAAGNESAANPDIPAGLPFYFQGATAPTGITQANYDAVNPSHYDWSKNWVAVVSLNSSNTISSFSNQCGVAMNWCLAAPGEITMSTSVGGGYTGAIEGTSFAAPNVTGAIADMLGAWPQLTPEKVLQILFSTATDLGAPGVDPVYGHGLINLEKATSPTDGGWSLTSLSGSSFSYYTSALELSAPFGNAVNISHDSLQFLDAYGRNYTIPISAVARNLTQISTDYDKLVRFSDPPMDNVLDFGNNSSLSFSTESNQNSTPRTQQNKLSKLSYASVIPTDTSGTGSVSLAFNYNTNIADAVAPSDHRTIASDALRNPYLALIDTVNSSVMDYTDGPLGLKMASYFGKLNHDDEYQYDFNTNKSISGVFSEITYDEPGSKSKISLDNGVNIENNSLLGSEGSGALSINKAVTYYTGVSGKYALSDDVALIANYNIGITKADASENSLVVGFDNIITNAFAVGSEVYNIADNNDTLGFLVSQPLRVTQGNAALTVPIGVEANGNIFFGNEPFNLVPSGRELDFESYYNLKSEDDSDFGVDVMFRLEPNNTPGGNDTTVLATYKTKFSADMFSF